MALGTVIELLQAQSPDAGWPLTGDDAINADIKVEVATAAGAPLVGGQFVLVRASTASQTPIPDGAYVVPGGAIIEVAGQRYQTVQDLTFENRPAAENAGAQRIVDAQTARWLDTLWLTGVDQLGEAQTWATSMRRTAELETIQIDGQPVLFPPLSTYSSLADIRGDYAGLESPATDADPGRWTERARQQLNALSGVLAYRYTRITQTVPIGTAYRFQPVGRFAFEERPNSSAATFVGIRLTLEAIQQMGNSPFSGIRLSPRGPWPIAGAAWQANGFRALIELDRPLHITPATGSPVLHITRGTAPTTMLWAEFLGETTTETLVTGTGGRLNIADPDRTLSRWQIRQPAPDFVPGSTIRADGQEYIVVGEDRDDKRFVTVTARRTP